MSGCRRPCVATGSAILTRAALLARSLIPYNIFRSMSSEAGSIGIMPIRAAKVGSRKRLRLISRVEPLRSSRTSVQTQLPSSERQASTRSGSTRPTRIRFEPYPIVSPTSGCWNSGRTRSALCMFRPMRFSIQS